MGSPFGGGFFHPCNGGTAGDRMFESLAANVLRSLQFSYLLMKGFSATSRALKDVGNMSDRGLGSSVPRGGRAGSSSCSLSVGRTTGMVDVGFGGFWKRPRKLRNNFRPRASSSEKGPSGPDGPRPSSGSGECKGISGTKTSRVEKALEPTPNGSSSLSYGSEVIGEAFSTDGHGLSGLDLGGTRLPAESVLVSKYSSGLSNRTLSITGLGAVDGVSVRLKPMGKGFAKGVKMASGVVKGVKTATGVLQKFSAPAESVVMGFGAANGVIMGYEAAKFIVSSAKISKDFVSVWKLTKMYRDRAAANAAKSSLGGGKTLRERFAKGLKASDGALTLVKLTREFGGGMTSSFPSGLSNWDLITKGYEVSSGVLKVSEVALGWKGGMISLLGKGFVSVKGAVSGVGVVVKTVVLTKEISVVVLKGIGLWRGSKKALKVIKEKRESGDFLFFKAKKKDLKCEEPLGAVTMAIPAVGPGPAAWILSITCDHAQCGACETDASESSLLLSLASLLYAEHQCSLTLESSEASCFLLSNSAIIQPCCFYLALPS
ncbi:hypothetical protein MPTK1_6g11300 [Marchantia polymorpha subsp. ruderalis]|uniref:Senescence domain-containing protein n=2 Tax=Marchantia polymorpha TaxID=3197 RepID=A0AAF6BQV9_MARPO|nr:hypothetical protein MARPO_0016s0169 [Marchantia polymorpha]BBN14393.1 hypothetical protein Mp_6g11300 [Marchantia polymorpha subsp. ruderalis]|eukprot:PTQ45126.1 hypothetical protein MARPO_0016s0169 [Marchantia polymorpha]